jgi:hypothetical protein
MYNLYTIDYSHRIRKEVILYMYEINEDDLQTATHRIVLSRRSRPLLKPHLLHGNLRYSQKDRSGDSEP